VVLNSITARFCLRSYDSAICLPFFKHLSRDYEKTTITAMHQGRWFAYKQTNKYLNNIQITWKTIHLRVFCRTNSPSIDQSRAEGNNTECVGKKRFNGRVLPMGFRKSMCYIPLFWTRYYIIFFSYGYL
jgi:hypothetical protein